MKNLLLFCLLFSSFTFSQNEDNTQRIEELPALIQQHRNQEDYVLASYYLRELEYRKQMALAITAKDYAQASRYKDSLGILFSRKPETTDGRVLDNMDRHIPPKNVYWNFEFSFLGYGHTKFNHSSTIFSQSLGTDVTSYNYGEALNIKFGGNYLFNLDKSNRFGIGFNIISAQLYGKRMLSSPNFAIAPLNPGFIYSHSFNPLMGLDFQVNAGTSIFIVRGESIQSTLVGMNISAALRYWVRQIAIGIDFNYGNFLKDRGFSRHTSITIGFRH